MLNKYFLLLVGLVAVIYVSTTNAYGVCSCSCCSGAACEPRFEGTVVVPSCDELNCIQACKEQFSLECNDPTTSEVEAPCQEIDTTTVPTTQTSTTTTSTSPVTTSTANITVTITTTVTTLPTTTSSESSTTTATVTTASSTSSAQTSSSTITPLTTASSTATSISTQTSATPTKPSSSAFIVRESPSLIALLITSILIITNLIL